MHFFSERYPEIFHCATGQHVGGGVGLGVGSGVTVITPMQSPLLYWKPSPHPRVPHGSQTAVQAHSSAAASVGVENSPASWHTCCEVKPHACHAGHCGPHSHGEGGAGGGGSGVGSGVGYDVGQAVPPRLQHKQVVPSAVPSQQSQAFGWQQQLQLESTYSPPLQPLPHPQFLA